MPTSSAPNSILQQVWPLTVLCKTAQSTDTDSGELSQCHVKTEQAFTSVPVRQRAQFILCCSFNQRGDQSCHSDTTGLVNLHRVTVTQHETWEELASFPPCHLL